jgi:tetratricopeptide (TPR) repeat protein
MACLNGYEEEIAGLMSRGSSDEIAQSVVRLEAEYKAAPTPEGANDLGVAQVLAGNYTRAVDVLSTLEKQHPGLSRTASNLGTALELAGRNKEALQWIKEGIRRDPADHQGTEWLHVKILEARLALESDPAWLKRHTVLGMDFGTGPRPQIPAVLLQDHLGQARSLVEARKAISYQLHERLKFVEAPNAVVGDLYFAWGNIAYVLGEELPPDYYRAALYFGAEHAPLIKLRADQYESDQQGPSHPMAGWMWTAVALFLAAVALFAGRAAYRKRRAILDA